jgi:hypothetical protein
VVGALKAVGNGQMESSTDPDVVPLVVAISAGNPCCHRVFGLTCDAGRNLRPDFAITPAIRFIPSYQHIWDPIAAQVSKHENGADVFLSRITVAF